MLWQQPPMFPITETHSAATWLLHPDAPKVEPPAIVTERIRRMLRKEQEAKGQAAGQQAEAVPATAGQEGGAQA